MPLSDNEQRLLEQMERALYAEDPKFASTMRGAKGRGSSWGRLALGAGAIVAGLFLLVLGVAQAQIPLGVLGFLAMLGGTVLAVSSRRVAGPAGVVDADGTVRRTKPGKAGVKNGAGPKRTSSFMQRLEQRWDKRRDQR